MTPAVKLILLMFSSVAMLFGNKKLLLLVIVSIQASLLDYGYARRLKVTGKSITSDLHSNDPLPHKVSVHRWNTNHQPTLPPVTNPPCLPSHLQMKYLYATNSFNGNILSHSLKAMEIDRNMTKQEVTAEDIAIIENVTDPSRFTPADMELINKAVCAKILQQLDAELQLHSSTALCGWDYVCDYRADRFPNYLFKARCKTAQCHINSCRKRHSMCQSYGIYVTVLERRECREWVWAQELLPLNCNCNCV